MTEPKRVCILIVAYNAVTTLARVLDRIPAAVWDLVSEVVVQDDASPDDTYLLAEGYKQVRGREKITVIRHARNLGYGGNQKAGYRYAIERGYDLVVLLHGDGQYAPEVLPELLRPLLEDRADAVLGSRMMTPGAARTGGMPLYKLVGNRILTWFQNRSAGARLSEWHSGYRVYSTRALRAVPFDANTDDFHFDTEIILQLLDCGLRVAEIPIPTYYGNEICYVNGLAYAKNVFGTMVRHRLHRIGLRSYAQFAVEEDRTYRVKRNPWSSHAWIARAVPPGSRVLDVGCEAEIVGGFLDKGCRVVGINRRPIAPEVSGRMERFHVADLESEFPVPGHEEFDCVVLADVLEHLRSAPEVLEAACRRLAPGGRALLSTGNVGHWWVRLGLLTGRFRYGRRGILDETHVKLYTLDTFIELIRGAGLLPVRVWATPVPWELALPGRDRTGFVRFVTGIDATLAAAWKRMFAFQFVVEARPDPAAGAGPSVVLRVAENISPGLASPPGRS